MGELHWDADADEAMSSIEADPSLGGLLAQVNAVLDQLGADPTVAAVRRRRYDNGLWGVVVRSRSDERLILWEDHPTLEGDVVIQYLGPDI